MLTRTGPDGPTGKPWVDDRFYNDEGKWRGSEVHRLTLDLDLEAITVDDYVGPYRGWLLAYAQAIAVLRPEWSHLEEPFIHPTLRFGGRVDRAGSVYKLQSVCEIKSGKFHKSHPIQTALQAILIADELRLPAELIGRFCIYIEGSGRFKVEEFPDRVDLRHARRVLRDCCEA